MEVFLRASQAGRHFLAEYSIDLWITVEMVPTGCCLCGQASRVYSDRSSTWLALFKTESILKSWYGLYIKSGTGLKKQQQCHARSDQGFLCLSINKILGNLEESRT